MVKSVQVFLQVMSPMAHGAFGDDAGNAVPVRRVRVVSLPGMPRIPCVSGNALRGILRRLVMRDLLLDRAGLGPGSHPHWDRLYAALANGGHLEGEGDATVRPEEVRRLRESLPPLSVFGAALYSWMLPGHMSVGFVWPRCRETLAAGLVSEAPDISAEDLIDEVTLCRHIDREMHDPEASGVTPMPTTVEVFAPGTILESSVVFARSATAIETACVAYGLRLLRTLGGRSGVGFGVVHVDGPPDDTPYLEWLASTPDLRDRLEALADKLARKAGAVKATKSNRAGNGR